ncbi:MULTISPECIES: LexA family protein [Thermoanaerobacterium]|uniref:SOS response transcriptional repressor, RecA-mediated autopeptidase n=3 Tax=Thermoanaerobacterium TaxID=28895 RepID=L0IR06_THETR|nr:MULTISPECIES: S24 family peptidase [Thermoanaerobacterium]AFK94371.1 Peptidase S24/S26A/S26B, conserved region [Thermoanaerobacterium saccharolyticum JW/SL-YS485]AGB20407.1 SOS response transcriptional repressor, RecA-mediated autopeptidase [Thermoanaerobacterium thermosaccharolyticum M0795]ETO39141.1 Peptidase S24/S26A/S26B [Thermoanaerobacterium aotearoense SCUT27]
MSKKSIESSKKEKDILPSLTSKQKAFLQDIIDFYNLHGRVPTVNDLSDNSKSLSNIYRVIRVLLTKGYLGGNIRNLKILYNTDGKPFEINSNYIIAPLYKTTIKGTLSLEDYYYLDKKFINKITALDDIFLIKASDDALKNIGILEGMLLIVLKSNIDELENDDIAVIKCENKLICRLYNKTNNTFYSISALYAPIKYEENLEILGKVISSINVNYKMENFS